MKELNSRAVPATGEACPDLGNDLLRGADQIAAFLFGNPGERRKIYHLAETSRFPVFRLGSTLCARKTRILSWIEQQEARGPGNE